MKLLSKAWFLVANSNSSNYCSPSQSVTHSLCLSVTLCDRIRIRSKFKHCCIRWNIFTIKKYFWNIFQLKTIKTHFYSQLEDFQPCSLITDDKYTPQRPCFNSHYQTSINNSAGREMLNQSRDYYWGKNQSANDKNFSDLKQLKLIEGKFQLARFSTFLQFASKLFANILLVQIPWEDDKI